MTALDRDGRGISFDVDGEFSRDPLRASGLPPYVATPLRIVGRAITIGMHIVDRVRNYWKKENPRDDNYR